MNPLNEIDSSRRLLREIGDLCDHASLTGSLATGVRRTAQRYNALLEKLVLSGHVPQGLFAALPETADYGEIGVEARMLASYISGKGKHREDRDDDGDRSVLVRLAPFIGSDELGMLVREQVRKGGELDMNILTAIAPFMDQGLLGQLVRERLAAPAGPEAPKTPPIPERPVYERHVSESPVPPVAAATWSVRDLLERLKNPHLSSEEREVLVERLQAKMDD